MGFKLVEGFQLEVGESERAVQFGLGYEDRRQVTEVVPIVLHIDLEFHLVVFDESITIVENQKETALVIFGFLFLVPAFLFLQNLVEVTLTLDPFGKVEMVNLLVDLLEVLHFVEIDKENTGGEKEAVSQISNDFSDELCLSHPLVSVQVDAEMICCLFLLLCHLTLEPLALLLKYWLLKLLLIRRRQILIRVAYSLVELNQKIHKLVENVGLPEDEVV